MKKIVFGLFIITILAGCSGRQLSDEEMATRVAQILTTFPTNSPAPATPTEAPPTLEPSPLPATATATLEPSATLTSTPEVTSTSEVPSVTPPPVTETPTPTAAVAFTAPAGDPVARLGNPTSTDPMDGPERWTWTVGASDFTNLEFKEGALLLNGLSDISGWRLAGTESLQNVYIEMAARLEQCSGSDNYGIIFRVPVLREADQGYLFGFTCDGRYYLKKWDGKVEPDGSMTSVIASKTSKAIQAGPKVFNRMGVMVINDRIILYANGTLLEEVRDTTYTKGYFGVFINPDNTEKLTVRVDQMSYWLNPTP